MMRKAFLHRPFTLWMAALRRLRWASTLCLVCLPHSAHAEMAPAWYEGQSRIDLPFVASTVLAGPAGTAVAISAQDRAVALIDVAEGSVIGLQRFDGIPVSVAPIARLRDRTAIAVLSRADDGSLGLDIMAFDDDRTLTNLPFGKVADLFTSFKSPQLIYADLDADRGELPRRLIILEGDRNLAGPAFLLSAAGGIDQYLLKDNPSRLLPIGAGEFLLGIHPKSNLLSVVDMLEGELVELVSADGLDYSDPQNYSVFAPMAPEGGTGSIVIANGDKALLTVVTVTAGKRLRFDLPLQFSLMGRPPIVDGNRRLLVATDVAMQFILVGAQGSARLQIVRRINGGLDMSDSFALDQPLLALTALAGPGSYGKDVFVMLAEGGRELMVSDIASLESRIDTGSDAVAVVARPARKQELGDLRSLPTDEVARLQRTLAGLGYRVGAIDGRAGVVTETALRAFQVDQGQLPTGRVDDATADALLAALGQAGVKQDGNVTVQEFDGFLDKAMGRDVDGARLMVLGATQENPDNPCFGLNGLPPKSLWPNAVKVANLLARLETIGGSRVRVLSAYQTDALSRCLGKDAHEGHTAFQAVDIVPLGPDKSGIASEADLAALAATLGGLEVSGLISADVQLLDGYLHVAPRIGTYRTAISSYPTTRKGCALARGDVEQFARLLAGSELAGREIYVARQSGTDVYVVTVDSNNDPVGADIARKLIRQAAPRSDNGKAGSDAFVMKGDVFLDGECGAAMVIPQSLLRKKKS